MKKKIVTVDSVFGCLKSKVKKPFTIEEMDEGIKEAIRKRWKEKLKNEK